ncbi:MAG: hypothetical protein IJU50_06150 [Lachnospiraceae bacterium]|nr:hypothetical protein [Lachnospiraceae bacterium]
MNKISIASVILFCSLLLCSCGVYFPELTEDETDLITEYAVDVIVRHSKGSDYRLVDDAEQQLQRKREREMAVEALKKQRQQEEEEQERPSSEDSSLEEIGGGSSAPQVQTVSINDMLGTGDVRLEWDGFEIMDSYASSQGYSFDSWPGNKLLVLEFRAYSNTGGEANLDVASIRPIFRVAINGQNSKVVDTTSLLNDLAYYRGSVSPEGTELVLVREISDTDAGGVQTVGLTGEIDGTSYNMGSK